MSKNNLFVLIALVIWIVGYLLGGWNQTVVMYEKAIDAMEVQETISKTGEVATGEKMYSESEVQELMSQVQFTILSWSVSTGEEKKVEEVKEEVFEEQVVSKIMWRNAVELNENASINVFRTRTGVAYMDALNAKKVKLPSEATDAILEFTLDLSGKPTFQYWRTTFNITIWYKDCKYNVAFNKSNQAYWSGVVNWKETFPKSYSINLAKLVCADRSKYNSKYEYNAIEDLKAWKRIAIFFAKEDGLVLNPVLLYK